MGNCKRLGRVVRVQAVRNPGTALADDRVNSRSNELERRETKQIERERLSSQWLEVQPHTHLAVLAQLICWKRKPEAMVDWYSTKGIA